jgi:hypothetical protein
VVHKPCWNEFGSVEFVLKKKKHNVGKLTRYDDALLAIFFKFSRVLCSLLMLVEKKKRWPLGGIFELPTWFITT